MTPSTTTQSECFRITPVTSGCDSSFFHVACGYTGTLVLCVCLYIKKRILPDVVISIRLINAALQSLSENRRLLVKLGTFFTAC